eukprot:403359811
MFLRKVSFSTSWIKFKHCIIVGGSANDSSIAPFQQVTNQPIPIVMLYKDGMSKWGKQFYSQTGNQINSVSAVNLERVTVGMRGVTKIFMFEDEEAPTGIIQGSTFAANVPRRQYINSSSCRKLFQGSHIPGLSQKCEITYYCCIK